MQRRIQQDKSCRRSPCEWALSLSATQRNANNTLPVWPKYETQTLPTYCSAYCTALSGTMLPAQCHRGLSPSRLLQLFPRRPLSRPREQRPSSWASLPLTDKEGSFLWAGTYKKKQNMIKWSIEEQLFVSKDRFPEAIISCQKRSGACRIYLTRK